MDGIDPYRLVVAAHELGHLVGYQLAGLTIHEVRVLGEGDAAEGYVRLDPRGARGAHQARAYMVGLLAGRVAGVRWCELHGVAHRDDACTTDRTLYRRFRTHPLVRDVPDAEFRAAAQQLVRTHWPRIARLAPRLARRGWLAP